MSLTQEQIDFFNANGYLSYGPLLTGDELQLFRDAYDRLFEKAFSANEARNLSEVENAEGGTATATKPRQMYQLMQLCEKSIEFRRLIQDARILDVIADLMRPNIMLYHDQALWKPAHTGGPVHWHQDNAYWHCRPANLVSCWLTLDDVRLENGAMQVIPGSHLKPIWHDRAQERALLKLEGIDQSKVEVIDLPAGGCMFHHCQTLHTTAPNDTDIQRRAFAIHYMQPGTRQTKGANPDQPMASSFAKPILRMSV